MAVIAPPPTTSPRLGLALAVFALVVLGVPVFELASARWPGQGVALAGPGLVDGRVAHAIETELALRSATAALVRPAYLELQYLVAGRTPPQVLVGRDHWLFLACLCEGYPPPRAASLIAARAVLVRRTVAWLEAAGCRVVLVPVPEKSSMAPHMLPPLATAFRSLMPDVLLALQAEGLTPVDARAALDPALADSWLSNDTHWMRPGACRVAALTAAAVRVACGGTVPGTEVAAHLTARIPMPYRSSLQAMLGFRPDSPADRQFTCTSIDFCGLRDDTGPVVTEDDDDIVCCGTSFTKHFGFASMVGAALGRRVHDRSAAAAGPVRAVVDVVTEALAGTADLPRVLVWEIPERFFVQDQDQWTDVLEPFLARLPASLPPPRARAGPLRPRATVVVDLDLTAPAVGSFTGTASGPHPCVELSFDPPIPGDGSFELAFRISAVAASRVSLAAASGAVWDDARRASATVARDPRGVDVSLVLRSADGNPVSRVEFTPTDGPAFLIDSLRWRRVR